MLNVKRISVKCIFSCAHTEYMKWLLNTRMIVIGVLLIFIHSFVITPLQQNAALMEEPLNILEPFIALLNSEVVQLIIPLIYLTLIADQPRVDNTTIYYIYRIGRLNWLIGQIVKLIMMTVSYMLVIFFGAVIPMISKGFWYNGWSNSVVGFSEKFPQKSGNAGALLIPENLYNQLSVYESAVISAALTFAYLMTLGLILLSFTINKRKHAGFALCGILITLGTAFCSLKTKLMWTMPMANSIIWMHYTKYFREPEMPVWFSVCYMSGCILILLILSFVSLGNFNYISIAEADD